MSAAESALNALRRLPENRFCGTCRKEDRFGHKNVCMKFGIFVCSECKSAHQAFSHKCKSVTMSNWTMAEVDELKPPRGGNAKNRATIFAKLKDDSDAWPKSCPPEVVKEFVQLAYDKLRWHDPAASTTSPRSERSASAVEVPPSTPTIGRTAPSVSAPDIFFADFAEVPTISSCRTAPLPQTTSASLLGEDLVGVFESPSSTKPGSDDWGAFTTAPAAVDEWSGFEGVAGALPAVPTPTPPMAMDPFGGIAESLATNAAPIKPIPTTAVTPLAGAAGLATSAPVKAALAATPSPPDPTASPATVIASDPFSSLGASGFASLGAIAPIGKSATAPTPPPPKLASAAKPLSGVGVAKDLSGPAAAARAPAVMSAPLRTGAGTAGALGAEFIDASAYRTPAGRGPPCVAFPGRGGASLPQAMPHYPSVRAA